MPSQAFLNRMDNVLASRVKQDMTRTRSRLAPLWNGLGVVGVTLGCIVLLKAAALAQGSTLSASPPAEADIGAHVRFWLTGADPVSSALATLLRPETTARTLPPNPFL